MPTPKRTAANRRNAQKSTGPKTAQGKLNSSKNAVKHGLLAKVVPAETEGWNELLTGLYESLRPQDELQRFLVDQVAHCMIRLQRSAASEERWLTGSRVIPVPEGRQYECEESPGLAPLAFARIDPFLCGEHCHTLLRYEAAANRQIKRNLEMLMKLQSASWGRPESLRDPYLVPQEEDTQEAVYPNLPQPPAPHFANYSFSQTLSPLEGEDRMPAPIASGPAPETSGEGRQDGLLPTAVSPTLPSPAAQGEGPGVRADNELASFRNNGVNGIYNGAEKNGG